MERFDYEKPDCAVPESCKNSPNSCEHDPELCDAPNAADGTLSDYLKKTVVNMFSSFNPKVAIRSNFQR